MIKHPMKKILLIVSTSILYSTTLFAKAIIFTENKGQIKDQHGFIRTDIYYSGSAGSYTFHFKKNGISYQLYRIQDHSCQRMKSFNSEKRPFKLNGIVYRIDLEWLNTEEQSFLEPGNILQNSTNYYNLKTGNEIMNIKSFANVCYRQIYPGIDIKWYEKEGRLKYDYIIAPKGDYKLIRLRVTGAQNIFIDNAGALHISTPLGNIIQDKPCVVQNGKKLNSYWIKKNNIISIEIENADNKLPLIIDPLIRSWGTYFGGSLEDNTWYITRDLTGNIYCAGDTKSIANIATSGAHQVLLGAGTSNYIDAYLAKYDGAGNLLWATYYGGEGTDNAYACATDQQSNVYLVGTTTSTNSNIITTAGAHQTNYGGLTDAFIVKFNSLGVRLWGTFYGGAEYDVGYGCAVDPSGNVYMSGTTATTLSTIISTPGSHQSISSTNYDAFIVKFDASGNRLWGTYYGGTGYDEGLYCCTDQQSNLYLVGGTISTANISSPGSHQLNFGGGTSGSPDGFLVKFNSSGQRQWGTYYGGAGPDWLNNCVADSMGNIFFSGTTSSPNVSNVIASSGAHQNIYGGGPNDVMVGKFDQNGMRVWCTYYGGNGNDEYGYCSLDNIGAIYLSGKTTSSSGNAISTPCTYQPVFGGGQGDAFLAKFSTAGSREWGTYYGGSNAEQWATCTADKQGNVFLAGSTASNSGTIIASMASQQSNFGGGASDSYLVKFGSCTSLPPVNTTPANNMKICSGTTSTLTTNVTCGVNWYASSTATISLATGSVFITPVIISDTTFYVEEKSCSNPSGRISVNLTVMPLPTLTINSSAPTICLGESVTLTVSGAITYSWTNNNITSNTIQITPNPSNQYMVWGIQSNGCSSFAFYSQKVDYCLFEYEAENFFASKVFPNPNQGIFEVAGNPQTDTKFLIFNNLGELILEVPLTNSLKMNLATYEPGLYNYYIKDEIKIIKTGKFIIVPK
jgi:hypothetical protein